MLLFAAPVLIVPVVLGLVFVWAIWAFLSVIIDRIRGPKVIYTPKKDSPEFIEAVRTGYTPRLGLELSEVFPDAVTGQDIDRLLAVRKNFFPVSLADFSTRQRHKT